MTRACAGCGAPRPCHQCEVAPWYSPHPHQRPVHRSRARTRNICAGRQGGKTLCAAVEFVRSVYRDLATPGRPRVTTTEDLGVWDREPRLHYWVVAPQSSLYRPSIRYVLKALPEGTRAAIAAGQVAGYRRAPWPQLLLPGDVMVEWKSGEHPEALVSEGLDGVWLTEAARLKAEVWRDNVMPALVSRAGWVLTDTTPIGQNWYYQHLWRLGDPRDSAHRVGVANFAWRTVDNTAVPVIVAEVETARAVLSPVQFRREYEASFEAFSGQIYEVGPQAVFSGPVSPGMYREVIGGFDWGRASPGALIIVGVRADDGYDVLAEDYAAGRLSRTWIAAIERACDYWHPTAIYSDPSSPLLDDMRDAGLPVEPARERSVVVGIERVAELLARGRLRIHAGCVNLLREMGGYRWRASQTGSGDVPEKGEDHACFPAGTMIATERGDVPIEAVQVGERVWTRAGLRAVTAAGCTGVDRPLVRVLLGGGRSLTATPDHPVWTDERGFVRLDALRYGDMLRSWQEPKSSRTLANVTDGTRRPRTTLRVSTTADSTMDGRSSCIEFSGRKPTDQFQKVTTSTIGTETRSTTRSATWNVSRLPSTGRSIVGASGRQNSWHDCAPTWTALVSSPASGTAARPVERGTGGMGARLGLRANLSGCGVTSAERHSPISRITVASAPTRARAHGVAPRTLTTSSESASSAGRRFAPASTRSGSCAPVPVRLIGLAEPCGVARAVYGLTVDGEHEYFADGVLVRNCDALRYAVASHARPAPIYEIR